jgi:REP element-mobilizing transposase RayT
VLVGLRHDAENAVEQSRRIEAYLDAGYGACWLKQPEIAERVEEALLHWDGTRYHLLAWCVMPNHVHVLIETQTDFPLSGVVHSWKSFLAHAINQHLARTGAVWMQDYFDRYIRGDHHLAATVAYIHANPVKAGLVQDECDWPHSSARLRSAGVSPAAKSERDARGPDARGPSTGPETP